MRWTSAGAASSLDERDAPSGGAARLRAGFPDVDVVCGDIRTFDWSAGPFDLVVFDLDTRLKRLGMTELIARARDHLVPAAIS